MGGRAGRCMVQGAAWCRRSGAVVPREGRGHALGLRRRHVSCWGPPSAAPNPPTHQLPQAGPGQRRRAGAGHPAQQPHGLLKGRGCAARHRGACVGVFGCVWMLTSSCVCFCGVYERVVSAWHRDGMDSRLGGRANHGVSWNERECGAAAARWGASRPGGHPPLQPGCCWCCCCPARPVMGLACNLPCAQVGGANAEWPLPKEDAARAKVRVVGGA